MHRGQLSTNKSVNCSWNHFHINHARLWGKAVEETITTGKYGKHKVGYKCFVKNICIWKRSLHNTIGSITWGRLSTLVKRVFSFSSGAFEHKQNIRQTITHPLPACTTPADRLDPKPHVVSSTHTNCYHLSKTVENVV